MDRVLFGVPIYYRTFERYCNDYEADKKRSVDYICQGWHPEDPRLPGARKRHELWYERRYFRSWKYTDIVAWVDIYCDGDALKARLYRLAAKRVTKKTKKKQFLPPVKTDDVVFTTHLSNEEVVAALKCYLLGYQQLLQKKRRYLYVDEVLGLLEHLDVKGWIEETKALLWPVQKA